VKAFSRETIFFPLFFFKGVLFERQGRSVLASTVHQLDKCWVKKRFFFLFFFFNSVPFEKQALRDFRRSILSSTVHQLEKNWVQKLFFFTFCETMSEFCKYDPTERINCEGVF